MAKAKKSQEGAEALTPDQKRIAQLEAQLKAHKVAAVANPKDVQFETEEEGSFHFTCMKFNMDNVEYDAAEVVAGSEAEAKAKKVGPFTEVLAKLVQMKSGIIQLIED
ncbi:MAG TPA: hypothetical protein VK589_21285 [Chryseolinea sp.]|nr:hypothetical protein [Chryseolinea sp.]